MRYNKTTFREEILSSENVLWSGKPQLSKMLNTIDYFLIPLGIVWTFGGIFYQKMAIDMFLLKNASKFGQYILLVPILIVAPVIFIGIYLLIVRFIVLVCIKKKTLYMITKNRIYIIQNGFSRSIKSIDIDKITDMELFIGKNGIGTIFFSKTPNFIKIISIISLEIPWIYRYSSKFTFFDIKNAENVKLLLDDLKR